MSDLLDRLPVVTVLVVVYAIAGAAVVVFHPETLDFKSYLEQMTIAAAGLGIGRGIASAGRNGSSTPTENSVGSITPVVEEPVQVLPGEGDPLPNDPNAPQA